MYKRQPRVIVIRSVLPLINHFIFRSKSVRLTKNFAKFFLSDADLARLRHELLFQDVYKRQGYIFRCYGADYMDALTGNSNDYVYFVDGWLDAVSYTHLRDCVKRISVYLR